jgi:DNA helicase-2/ATP-dependent DNA helicase PcrA
VEKLFAKFDLYSTYNYPIARQILKKQSQGVQIMTAHGSKGLEYDTVFVAGVYYGNWENKRVVEKIKLPSLV